MSWLTGVIGRVLDIIRTAMPAFQTQDGQTGGSNNTAEQQQPVSQELKAKRSRVKTDIQAQSAKVETLRAQTRIKKSKAVGTPQVTPAPQPVQSKRKPAAKAAQSTTPAKLRKPAQKAAQAVHGEPGKPSKPTARKTRQHAK